jgi:hypothetical protein
MKITQEVRAGLSEKAEEFRTTGGEIYREATSSTVGNA